MSWLHPIYWKLFDWQAFSTLAAGAMTVGAATVVGLGQLRIQRRQTAILEKQVSQKAAELRISLFERRYGAIEALRAAVEARDLEIRKEQIGDPKWPASQALPLIWEATRAVRFLFGDEVERRAKALEQRLHALARLKAELQMPRGGSLQSNLGF